MSCTHCPVVHVDPKSKPAVLSWSRWGEGGWGVEDVTTPACVWLFPNPSGIPVAVVCLSSPVLRKWCIPRRVIVSHKSLLPHAGPGSLTVMCNVRNNCQSHSCNWLDNYPLPHLNWCHVRGYPVYQFLLKPQVFHLWWIQKQPIIEHYLAVHHTDEPNKGKMAVCGSPTFLCWMAWEVITGCHK